MIDEEIIIEKLSELETSITNRIICSTAWEETTADRETISRCLAEFQRKYTTIDTETGTRKFRRSGIQLPIHA